MFRLPFNTRFQPRPVLGEAQRALYRSLKQWRQQPFLPTTRWSPPASSKICSPLDALSFSATVANEVFEEACNAIAECKDADPDHQLILTCEDKDPSVLWINTVTGLIGRWLGILCQQKHWSFNKMPVENVLLFYRFLLCHVSGVPCSPPLETE